MKPTLGTFRYASVASVVVVVVLFLTTGLSTHRLQRDELRVVGIAANMASGASSLAIPRQAGEPFLEKPPLGFAGVAASLSLFGKHRVSARLPGVLWSLVGVAFLSLLAWDLYGTRGAALATALALFYTVQYFWTARVCLVDPPLVAGVVAAAALGRRAVTRPDRRWLWFPLATVAATVAFFSKGAVGLVFPTLAFIGVLAGRRDASCLKSPWPWVSPLILVGGVGLWLFLVHAEGGEKALRVVVIDNHLRRFFPAPGYVGGHQQPFYYYVSRFPATLLPGLLVLPASLYWHVRKRSERPELREALWMCGCWFGLGFLVLSLAGTKRVLYLVPLLPPVALLVGGWLGSVAEEQREFAPVEVWTLRGILGASTLVAVAFPIALPFIPGEHTVLRSGVAPVVVLAAAGLAVLANRTQRRGPSLLLSLAAGAVAATSVTSIVLSGPALENIPGRSFYEQLDRIVPADQRVDVLGAHEASVGAISFYTGRIPRFEPHLEPIEAALSDSKAPYYVLVLDRDSPGLPRRWRALLGDGVHLLAQDRSGRLISTLLANRPGVPAPPDGG